MPVLLLLRLPLRVDPLLLQVVGEFRAQDCVEPTGGAGGPDASVIAALRGLQGGGGDQAVPPVGGEAGEGESDVGRQVEDGVGAEAVAVAALGGDGRRALHGEAGPVGGEVLDHSLRAGEAGPAEDLDGLAEGVAEGGGEGGEVSSAIEDGADGDAGEDSPAGLAGVTGGGGVGDDLVPVVPASAAFFEGAIVEAALCGDFGVAFGRRAVAAS